MTIPHLRVHKALAQRALAVVKRLGLLSAEHRVLRNDEFILIPLTRELSECEMDFVGEEVGEFGVDFREGVLRRKRPRDLIEALEDRLPPYLLSMLPKSYDMIGDVAVVEVPSELEPYKHDIGEALLRIHPHLRIVLRKASAVSGVYRTREYEVLAGSGGAETLHKEYGITLLLDVSKVYFSPRLAYERQRVASLVKEGEVVVDMFAGVGPFAIHIAKRVPKVLVYAIDINPDAYRYLLKNIELNRVEDKVKPMLGDCREIVDRALAGKADRVVMNLPEKAEEYLPWACKALRAEGGVIHFYCFSEEPKAVEKAVERALAGVERGRRSVREVLAKRRVKAVAPHQWQIGLDLLVT